MTARKSGSRLETEIERCRSEGQWDKIPELVRQLSAKLISNDDLGELLLGEAKLQQYIKENPIKQGASPRGPRPRLQEVRKHLTAALDRGNLKPEYMQEASLIMAKLCYVEGDYREALNQYSRVNLDEMQLVGAPVYRLSTIAEAYATKGLCLEKVPMASPSLSNRNADRDQEIITCYEKSGDIALLYLQEVEKALSVGIQNRSPKPGPVTQEQELGYFLETGLQRAHVIHFKNGNLTRGVGRFREILRAVETRTTQNLRMTIARQLAEILLRGMCEQSYWNPRNLLMPPVHSPLSIYFDLFCPQENTEEALLLLLISESMANRDAVLSRIPEHNNDRIISLQSASLVYDLLTIALGRRGQYEMLSESARAVKVLKECMRLKPDDPTIPLLAVKLCIGNLHWLEEGERFAKIVIDMGEKAAEFRAKGCLAIGLVYSLRATDASLRGMQEEYQKKALSAFQRAQSLSPTDHLAVFYLALQLAVSRQIPEALGYVRQALQLQGDDVHSLHLLALLLSAQKHYHDALNIIEMALSEYPENFILLFTKVKLETLCRGPEEALLSCKRMLQIWKSCYNLTNPRSKFSLLISAVLWDICREAPMYVSLPTVYVSTAGSVHATSIAASRVEQALSEVASSLQSSAPKQGPLHPWMTLAQIWLHAAEVYIGMGKAAEATACTQEAANLFPMSRNVLFMKGQVAELRGNVDEAKRWYEEALSISPTHVKTMQRLVSTCCLVNSTAHDVWNSLGEVLQAQGNDAAATECFLTALELEASCPILPFTIIPRTL
uniref:Tetratricopeptide repeat protein 7B-like n=1 Tax=Sinocyclocheilus rhinocerous TaxID=307959 RepID=A0A673LWK9_9TELE